MNVTDIQKRLDAMIPAMLAKGLVKPDARFSLTSEAAPHVSISWDKVPSDRAYDRAWHAGKGDTIEDRLADADAFIANLPTREETKVRNFMAAVAKAIDLGKETNIEAEFVNPLSVLMKTLSENALTYQRQPSSTPADALEGVSLMAAE